MVKFVYFDVGGVLLFDFSGNENWPQMQRDLGITAKSQATFDAFWKRYRERICLDCDVDTLIPELSLISGVTIPANYSLLSDFVQRFERNPEIWPLVETIAQHYQVGLLTNMYPRMLAEIEKAKLLPPIHWNEVIDSSVVGFQKPDKAIFDVAQERAGVQPSEILYIDNGEANVIAAQARGWQALLYDPQKADESNAKIRTALEL